jgi:hypothetical protein
MVRIQVSKSDLLEQINDLIRRRNSDDRSCDDCQIEHIRRLGEDRAAGEANWTVDHALNCEGCDYKEVLNDLRTRLDVNW